MLFRLGFLSFKLASMHLLVEKSFYKGSLTTISTSKERKEERKTEGQKEGRKERKKERKKEAKKQRKAERHKYIITEQKYAKEKRASICMYVRVRTYAYTFVSENTPLRHVVEIWVFESTSSSSSSSSL